MYVTNRNPFFVNFRVSDPKFSVPKSRSPEREKRCCSSNVQTPTPRISLCYSQQHASSTQATSRRRRGRERKKKDDKKGYVLQSFLTELSRSWEKMTLRLLFIILIKPTFLIGQQFQTERTKVRH